MKKLYLSVLIVILLFATTGCKPKDNLKNHISENRYNILTGEDDLLSIHIVQLERESPYCLDGIKGEIVSLLEISLKAADNTLEYTVTFEDESKAFGGVLNYDSTKKQHLLTIPFASKKLETIALAVSYEDTQTLINANSIIVEKILTPIEAVDLLKESKGDFFDNMTVDSTFDGEIHVRLLTEGQRCYYYIGLINKTGKIFAFLLNAANGQIIAQKEINYTTKLAY